MPLAVSQLPDDVLPGHDQQLIAALDHACGPRRGVDLSVAPDGDDVDAEALAKLQLREALHNVIANAVEACEDGGGAVTVSVRTQVAGGNPLLEIEVVDENRSVRSEDGSFSDAFRPLAVHIYRLKW